MMLGENTSNYLLSEPFRSENSPNKPEAIDPEKLRDSLSRLVLVIVKILIDVIEKQARRRVESDSLTSSEVEKLGLAIMTLKRSFEDTSKRFGFDSRELDLPIQGCPNIHNCNQDEGRTGKLLSTESASRNNLGLTAGTLVNVLDRLIEKKTTIAGEVTISLAGIELVVLHLLASLEPVSQEQHEGDRSKIRPDQKNSKKSGEK